MLLGGNSFQQPFQVFSVMKESHFDGRNGDAFLLLDGMQVRSGLVVWVSSQCPTCDSVSFPLFLVDIAVALIRQTGDSSLREISFFRYIY